MLNHLRFGVSACPSLLEEQFPGSQYRRQRQKKGNLVLETILPDGPEMLPFFHRQDRIYPVQLPGQDSSPTQSFCRLGKTGQMSGLTTLAACVL